jgi:uncharacterized protein (TIGR04255 family)
MPKKRLKKAPLVLVQAQIHFSDLPLQALGTEQELENLHKAMIKMGFAERIDAEVVEIGFQFNPEEAKDGYVQLKQQKKNSKRLVFRGFGRTQSVELTSNRLIIKNTRYKDYEQFSTDIRAILEKFTDHLGDLENVLIKQASIRYIDVILPSKENELFDYIQPNLLPFHPEFSEATVGMSQSIAKTGEHRFMIIMAEEVQAAPLGYPGRWLPVDMLESDQRAVLVLNPFLDSYQQGKNYGILNIDHRLDFPETPKWQQQEIMQHLDDLYALSSQFFWDAVTDIAKREWELIND